VLFNLSLIAALLIWKATGLSTPGHALAWGLIAAGFLQVGMLLFFAEKLGVKLRFVRPKLDMRTKKLFRLMGPGVVGAGVMHINLFADMIIASILPRGSISYLYYADRLNQLPLGVVGIAVGTALLPALSRAMSGGRTEETQNLFNRALEICLFLALPAAVGLFVLAHPIILALFRHGEFGYEAAEVTALVLSGYCIGLPAYIMGKVYSTVYWARHDTTTPVKASIASALFNVAASLTLIFGFHIGVVGIALATGLAGWVQLGLLHLGVRKSGHVKADGRLRRNMGMIVISCLCMAMVLAPLRVYMGDYFINGSNNFAQVLALSVMVFAGASSYAIAITATGVVKLSDLKQYIKRG
jgi:putative peptidoglycan lipid II flippase